VYGCGLCVDIKAGECSSSVRLGCGNVLWQRSYGLECRVLIERAGWDVLEVGASVDVVKW